MRGVGWRRLEDRRRTAPGVDDLLRVLNIGGEKQVNIKRIHVIGHRLTTGKGRAGDRQLLVTNGLEHTDARIRAIARHHHHLDQRGRILAFHMPVEIEQRLY
ncbi:hypothetical protein D3C75_1255130 [compost metagenome]